MKTKKNKLSIRTLALLTAAIVMLTTGGISGTRAAISAVSPDYDATIATNSIDVQLTENGIPVEEESKLYSAIGENVEPSRIYNDAIGVVNTGSADEYVRVIVRKYWTKADGSKDKELKPDMIDLHIQKESDWIVKDGGSDETKVYYYKNALKPGQENAAVLFDTLKISKDVMTKDEGKVVESTNEDGTTKTVITYTYKYDGYTFNVEAEAQSVQTHHAAEAIKSVWGVTAELSGDSISGIK